MFYSIAVSRAISGYDFTLVPLESHTAQGEGGRKQPRWSVVITGACGKHHPSSLHGDNLVSKGWFTLRALAAWPHPLEQGLEGAWAWRVTERVWRQVLSCLVRSRGWQNGVEGWMEGWGLSKRQLSVPSGSGGHMRGGVAVGMGGRWNCQPYKTSRNIKARGENWLGTEYNSSLACKGLQGWWIMTQALSSEFVNTE